MSDGNGMGAEADESRMEEEEFVDPGGDLGYGPSATCSRSRQAIRAGGRGPHDHSHAVSSVVPPLRERYGGCRVHTS